MHSASLSSNRRRRLHPVLPRLAAGAVVVRGDRVLLVQRGKPPQEGAWSIPGGGVEPGELIADAVIREAREETGLTVEPGPLLCLYERVERDGRGEVAFHHVVADVLCRCPRGVPRAGGDAAAARFVSLAEARALPLTEGLLPVMAEALRRLARPRRTGDARRPGGSAARSARATARRG